MAADLSPRPDVVASVAEIDSAVDPTTLRAAAKQARRAVAAELGRHMPTPTLAAVWSEVMRATVATAARLAAGRAGPRWTWFVLGSVGRGEAVPGSDVETLISMPDDVDDAGRTHAMTLAAEVHELVEACGLPLDDNGVLASRHAVARNSMLRDAIWARDSIPSRLGIFASQADRVDLKAAAIDPIVKIARWGALSAGSGALTTMERINDAAAASVIDPDDASSLRDCHVALSRLRWRLRTAPWSAGESVDDIVSLSELAPQERATVRSIGRELNGIRRKLVLQSALPS